MEKETPKRFSPVRLVIGGLLLVLAAAIAYSPLAWAEWQIANGMDYRGAWTTVAVLGIFIWAIASIIAGLGLFVALRRVTDNKG